MAECLLAAFSARGKWMLQKSSKTNWRHRQLASRQFTSPLPKMGWYADFWAESSAHDPKLCPNICKEKAGQHQLSPHQVQGLTGIGPQAYTLGLLSLWGLANGNKNVPLANPETGEQRREIQCSWTLHVLRCVSCEDKIGVFRLQGQDF